MIGFILSIFLTAAVALWLLLRRFEADLGTASFIVGWHALLGVGAMAPIIWLFVAEDKKQKRTRRRMQEYPPHGNDPGGNL